MRYGILISVRLPEIFIDIIRSTGQSVSEFIRNAVFQKIVEVCNDPKTVEMLKRQIEVEIMQLEIKIAELQSKREELEKSKSQLEESVAKFREFLEQAENVVAEHFDDLDKLLKSYSDEEVRRFIQARIEAISDRYGYPKSFILDTLLKLKPELSDLIGG